MRDFLLSKNRNFPFELFGKQHILMIIITLYLFVLIFIFRKKIFKLSERTFNILRIMFIFIILGNMLLYRGSYIYYGVYNIKIHLSLYYCHIVNYLFVIALLINYKPFYKFVYGLCWIGPIWTVIFPDFLVGIDCFIFYSSFISHNLLLVFITFILVLKGIKYNFYDFLKCLFIAMSIFIFTNVVNYDFGTSFNKPDTLLNDYIKFNFIGGNAILFIMGIIGNTIGLLINKIYIKSNCE